MLLLKMVAAAEVDLVGLKILVVLILDLFLAFLMTFLAILPEAEEEDLHLELKEVQI